MKKLNLDRYLEPKTRDLPRLTLRLPPDIEAAVKKEAAAQELSVNKFIELALRHSLEVKKK